MSWQIVEDDAFYTLRLVVALLLTATLGWERERRDRPAGLRTHALVGVSAALFAILGEVLTYHYAPLAGATSDPGRVTQAVVAGISFLGAGTVFMSKTGGISGLTTASSLLLAAGIGLAVGFERYLLAASTTALALIVLALFARFSVESTKPDAD
jgi:putative Mg2+ transporter-C (MgtC) family protein